MIWIYKSIWYDISSVHYFFLHNWSADIFSFALKNNFFINKVILMKFNLQTAQFFCREIESLIWILSEYKKKNAMSFSHIFIFNIRQRYLKERTAPRNWRTAWILGGQVDFRMHSSYGRVNFEKFFLAWLYLWSWWDLD